MRLLHLGHFEYETYTAKLARVHYVKHEHAAITQYPDMRCEM